MRRLLSSILAPFEKLRRALNSSPQGVLVFENSKVVFLNDTAEEYLSLKGVDIRGFPFDELEHDGPIGQSILQNLNLCLQRGAPCKEDLFLGRRQICIKSNPAGQGLVLVTIEQVLSKQPPQGADLGIEPDPRHPLLTPLILLNGVISEQQPKNEEASFLSHQIMRLLNMGRLREKKGCQEPPGSDFFEICRDLVNFVRYALPADVVVTAEIPDGNSGCSFEYAGLSSLLIQLAMDSAHEIALRGALNLSARIAEESVILRLECRAATGSLVQLNIFNQEQTRKLCHSLEGQLISWTEHNSRIRLVNLPAFQKHPTESEGKAQKKSASRSEGAGKTILLIDDEESIRSIGQTALNRFGYKVLLASDGVEGLRIFQKKWKEINLVLLDLVMPRLGGAACFEHLKEIDPRVRVVLMSGFTRNRRVNDLMARGCLYFLRKPFELCELVETVRESQMVKA